MIRAWLIPMCAASAAVLAGCSNPVDKAAKARIFTAEDPPASVRSAAETIDVAALAPDHALTRRVLRMSGAELTERLGPHKYVANVAFTWASGESQVTLNETRSVVAARGGVAGDFHAKIDNTREQGIDVMRVQGAVYARSRFGKYRRRLRDRGMAERQRQEVYGALRDLDELSRGQVRLIRKDNAQVHGRTATRFQVVLGDKAQSAEVGDDLPAPAFPKGGPDSDTAKRLGFFANRETIGLAGDVWVDTATAVVLKSKVTARLRVPPADGRGEAKLQLSVDSDITDIGKDPLLLPPKDFLPDADRPEGIAAVLQKFGFERQRPKDAAKP